jgi:uncharacterized membrane protein
VGSEYMTGEEAESETDIEEIPVVPTEPNPFWKQNAEKLVGESISSVEDTAKQFVTVTGLLEGIYFHAITFSDVRHMEGSSVLIYVAPLILWLLSLIFAVMVLIRKKYDLNINSSRDSKEKFGKIGRVRELLINSEKASASPIFEENVERFSCIRFSITHGHDRKILEGKYQLIRISSVFLIFSFVALIIAILHSMGIISYHTFEIWQNSSTQ